MSAKDIEREGNACKKLWFAVLFQAISDLVPARASENKDSVGVQDQAYKWFHSKRKNVGSFIWICDIFDLDADRMRTACMKRNAIHTARELITRMRRDDLHVKKKEREEKIFSRTV